MRYILQEKRNVMVEIQDNSGKYITYQTSLNTSLVRLRRIFLSNKSTNFSPDEFSLQVSIPYNRTTLITWWYNIIFVLSDRWFDRNNFLRPSRIYYNAISWYYLWPKINKVLDLIDVILSHWNSFSVKPERMYLVLSPFTFDSKKSLLFQVPRIARRQRWWYEDYTIGICKYLLFCT